MQDTPRMARLFSTLDLGYCDLLLACDRLDRLRAGLKGIPDPREYHEVLTFLTDAMETVRALEDLTLLPMLESEAPLDPASATIFTRLSREHCEDACQIEEIVEALESHARRQPILPPDAMRFMLGGFSTGLRRHIALERLLIQRWTRIGTA